MGFEVDSTMADESLGVAATKLPCTKPNDLCSDDPDSAVKDDQTHQIVDRNVGFGIDGFDESEPLIGLPLATEESFSLMAEREKQLLPRDDYLSRLRSGSLDLGLRRQALDWIWKANAHHNFGPNSVCLCVNYIDRFLSVFTLPRNKDWAVQLLAVSCLSLATKLMETVVPLPVDLQVGEGKYVFEGKTIQRMELLVLNTLNWRMGACTPCTFIDYFLRKTNDDHRFPSVCLMAKSFELILSTIKGIDFLEFRPSEVSAAVALSVSAKIHGVDIHKAVSCFINVEQERVLKCVELIQDLALDGGSGVGGGLGGQLVVVAPGSPNGVLETACLSYKSDDLTVGSCGNFPHSNSTHPRDTKRRKLDKQQPPPSTSSQQEEDLPKS